MVDKVKDQALVLAERIMDAVHANDRQAALQAIEELEVLLMVETAIYQALNGGGNGKDQRQTN